MRLSKHFIENWQKRIGGVPDIQEIHQIVNRAVRVQKGKRAVGRFADIKTLTIYWHPDRNIIITVDHFTQTVVSVYSNRNMPDTGKFTIGEAQGY